MKVDLWTLKYSATIKDGIEPLRFNIRQTDYKGGRYLVGRWLKGPNAPSRKRVARVARAKPVTNRLKLDYPCLYQQIQLLSLCVKLEVPKKLSLEQASND